jgi:glycyl-tRNA synthetase beta chain
MGQVLALADKLDMLISFLGIGKKPTGSGDPFGLRRAALGVIRILDEAKIDFDLAEFLHKMGGNRDQSSQDILSFMADRLQVYCRDRGLRYDVVRAVVTADQLSRFNILAMINRIKILDQFINAENGQAFMPAWRRVHSILESEQSKAETDISGDIDHNLFVDAAEQPLYDAAKAIDTGLDDATMLAKMVHLTPLINAFFEAVKVNDDNQDIRQNRLRLLAMLDGRIRICADLSEIEG